jgi:hypothetical protein
VSVGHDIPAMDRYPRRATAIQPSGYGRKLVEVGQEHWEVLFKDKQYNFQIQLGEFKELFLKKWYPGQSNECRWRHCRKDWPLDKRKCRHHPLRFD